MHGTKTVVSALGSAARYLGLRTYLFKTPGSFVVAICGGRMIPSAHAREPLINYAGGHRGCPDGGALRTRCPRQIQLKRGDWLSRDENSPGISLFGAGRAGPKKGVSEFSCSNWSVLAERSAFGESGRSVILSHF